MLLRYFYQLYSFGATLIHSIHKNQPTVFFSHTKLASATSHNTANRVCISINILVYYTLERWWHRGKIVHGGTRHDRGRHKSVEGMPILWNLAMCNLYVSNGFRPVEYCFPSQNIFHLPLWSNNFSLLLKHFSAYSFGETDFCNSRNTN